VHGEEMQGAKIPPPRQNQELSWFYYYKFFYEYSQQVHGQGYLGGGSQWLAFSMVRQHLWLLLLLPVPIQDIHIIVPLIGFFG
jgi:hypothetical protein